MLCYTNDKLEATAVWRVSSWMLALVCDKHAKAAVAKGQKVRALRGE